MAHTFGAISAYDGHRAGGKGRVVCDATWHHFVNVNLIGVVEGGGFDEFDESPGEARHQARRLPELGRRARRGLDKIKNYYTNIGVWISPPAAARAVSTGCAGGSSCIADRIMEAALTSPEIALERIPASTLMHIGIHARDAFGRRAGQCQTLEWLLDWLERWQCIEVGGSTRGTPVTAPAAEEEEESSTARLDPMPLVDVALGARWCRCARDSLPRRSGWTTS